MNYQTILTFLAIAEYGSMGKAAKHLNYSQQVVSEHLKQLEKHLQSFFFPEGDFDVYR